MKTMTIFPKQTNTANRGRNQRAFTLIEVTMAMGIMSVSLLVMVGLMPVGLSALRDSMDLSVKTQIVQSIAAQVQLTPYSKIDSYISTGPFYFTEEGILQTTQNDSTFFKVDLVSGNSSYPGTSALSSSEIDKLKSGSLTAIKVAICKTKGSGRVEDTIRANPFSADAPKAKPAPDYQVIQLANSYGNQ